MQFYERVKDRPNYDHAREQARIRLSREIESQPDNGWLRSRLGRLSEAPGEAEALLRAGVSISPDDWRCWMELGDFLAKRALDHALWTLGLMGVLPSHIRSYVTDTLRRLETMAERADPAVATAALTTMGELQGVVLGDYRMAEETLKRAIARNPLPDAPWESLVVLHAASEQPGKIADLLSLRLKTRDTARNHLLLAKAHEQLDHSDDAERQFMAVLKHEPENPVAAIGLASVRLKQARDEASLRSVGQYLSELESGLMKKVPPDMVLGFEFVHGIYFALDGNLGEARSHIRRLLAADPFNKDYQAANDALGR
jgi:tetratricopeptide (TPR) repeat protein